MEENVFNLFDYLLEHLLPYDSDMTKLDSIFDIILGWIFYIIDHFVLLFFGLLDSHSDDISLIGRFSADTMDTTFHFDFSSDFIYFFIGLLVVVFVFKLIWNFIASVIP